MKRRQFMKNSVLASLLPIHYYKWMLPSNIPFHIGLQLYTVRNEMGKDPIGTLKAIAELGYTDLECAGYQEGKFYGMDKEDFKKILDDFGLIMKSGHILTGAHAPNQKRTLTNDWEGACEDAAYMGQEHIVCPFLFPFERKDVDDYKKLAALFNRCGEIAKSYNLNFSYHNHDFEFASMDGIIPFDVLINETDPMYSNFELDLYWIVKAGFDPVVYFNSHPGRFILWHVKDKEDTEESYFTEVGNGTIGWKKIFENRDVAGLQRYYVEQDVCRNHIPMESIKISRDYLVKNGYHSY